MPLPSWLSEAARVERPAPLPRKLARDDGHCRTALRAQDAILRRLGAPPCVREELLAISALETAWFTSAAFRAGNVGGLKIKKDVADWHQRRMGMPARWFYAPGHTASGDKPVVAYHAFADPETCWRVLLERVFGTPVAAPWVADYREAAAMLWAGDPAWLRSLLVRGRYRGRVTAAAPDESIARHREIVARVRSLLENR
jgi:hypothetical protein